MDTSDPWIVFDNSDFCNHCNYFLKKKLSNIEKNKDRKDLFDLFEEIKSNNSSKSNHDVLIGISGELIALKPCCLHKKLA